MSLKTGSRGSNGAWDKPVKACIWRSSRMCRPIGGLPLWFFEDSLPHLLLRNNSNNYRPLMWGFYSPYRTELFRLSHVLTFRTATHDQSLINALHFIQRFQHTRRDHLPAEIVLDFASVRWQALIRTRRNMRTVLHRRHLEVCVFHYLDHGLRCGDVYVDGSEAYA